MSHKRGYWFTCHVCKSPKRYEHFAEKTKDKKCICRQCADLESTAPRQYTPGSRLRYMLWFTRSLTQPN